MNNKYIDNELYKAIQYHIDNRFLMTIDRCFNGETTSTFGFPICLSDKFILTTIITDFHDEGYAVLRTKDITDAYSNESDSFYEQICISEGLQDKIEQNSIKETDSLNHVLSQLRDYDGLICIQCEEQAERCSFYMGNIITIEEDNVTFRDVGTDGKLEDEIHSIPYKEITQVSFGDNYSKMYWKYVTTNSDGSIQ